MEDIREATAHLSLGSNEQWCSPGCNPARKLRRFDSFWIHKWATSIVAKHVMTVPAKASGGRSESGVRFPGGPQRSIVPYCLTIAQSAVVELRFDHLSSGFDSQQQSKSVRIISATLTKTLLV